MLGDHENKNRSHMYVGEVAENMNSGLKVFTDRVVVFKAKNCVW